MPPKRKARPQLPTSEPPATRLRTQIAAATRGSSELTPIDSGSSESASSPGAVPADVVPAHELSEGEDTVHLQAVQRSPHAMSANEPIEASPEHNQRPPVQVQSVAPRQTTSLCWKYFKKKELGHRKTKRGKMVADTAAECRLCQRMGRR
jgi:hypothetical protein